MQPDTHKMQAEIQALTTVSDRIRALNRAGYSRADIARFLGKRYQQVRNVLVGDEQVCGRLKPREIGAASQPSRESASSSAKMQVGAAGHVQLTASVHDALGLKEGDLTF